MNQETQPELHTKKKQAKFIKAFWRLSILIVSLFIFFLTLASFIGYRYQDEVKGYIISELNKQLETKIIIDGKDIDFAIIKNFPYASVDFKNVKALDATNNKHKDTLFSAKKISLQFNVMDIFHKKYRIKKIQIERVTLNIKISKTGKDNYHFWK